MKRGNSNIRILFFISSLNWGGAETHLIRLLNSLININNDITLLVASKGGVYDNDLDSRIDLIFASSNTRLESRFSMVLATAKLCKVIKKLRPQIVFSMMDHVNWYSIMGISLLNKKPILLCGVHNTPSEKYKGSIKGKVKIKLMRFVYNYPNLLIACSYGVKSDMIGLFPSIKSPIKVLNNAAITDYHIKLGYENINRKNHIPIIVTCGRLIKQKGYDLLLDSFALLTKRIKVKLVFIGDGPEKYNLIELTHKLKINGSVEFCGYIKNPYPKIARSDVFVSTSLFEGNPQVLIEAMALGVPVISSNCPNGPAEIISNFKNGFLIETRKPKDYAEAMFKILNKSELRNSILNNALKTAKSRHSNKIALEHNKLFMKLLEHKIWRNQEY